MNMAKRLAIVAFGLLFIAGVSARGAVEKKALDGKTFTVKLMKGDAKGGDTDTLTFKNGMFDSSACHQYGFGESGYTAKAEGAKVAFEVNATSKTNDKQVWSGTVDGATIQGTMKMTDPKGIVTVFRFASNVEPEKQKY